MVRAGYRSKLAGKDCSIRKKPWNSSAAFLETCLWCSLVFLAARTRQKTWPQRLGVLLGFEEGGCSQILLFKRSLRDTEQSCGCVPSFYSSLHWPPLARIIRFTVAVLGWRETEGRGSIKIRVGHPIRTLKTSSHRPFKPRSGYRLQAGEPAKLSQVKASFTRYIKYYILQVTFWSNCNSQFYPLPPDLKINLLCRKVPT